MLLSLLWPAALAFAVTVVMTAVLKRVAIRAGIVARPAQDRWHRSEIPLLGGLAIGLTVVILAVALAIRDVHIWLLLAAGVVMMFTGLVDDLRPVKPHVKLVIQVLIGSALASLGLQLRLTPYEALNVVITLAWIVGVTNAFNLLDNMDGLAAGVAAIAVTFRLIFFVGDGDVAGAVLCAVLLGSLLGFLVFNSQPASIFMGDAGSLFIGVIVSGLSLVGQWAYSRGMLSVLLFPVLILLVPIFDTAFVMVSRLLAGRPLHEGGRDHPSHRLVALGLSEREAVLTLYTVALLAGSIAYFSYLKGFSYSFVLIAWLVLALVLFGVFLVRFQLYSGDGRALPSDTKFVSLIANFAYKRQVTMVLVDLALVPLCYYTAYVLRFESALPQEHPRFIASLPIVIACQMSAFAFFRVYQGVWRYTSLNDLLQAAKAAVIGTLATVMLISLSSDFAGYSKSVFVLYALVLLTSVSASRLSYRALAEMFRASSSQGLPVVIYGAGDGGVMVVKELLNNPALSRRAVAFIDDDRDKQRTKILGIPVTGPLEAIVALIELHDPVEIVVSSPKIPRERIERLVQVCEPLGIPVVRAALRFES